MPNISVKRLIKKAAVSPAPFHSPGRRGRVKKKKNKTKNKLVVKTTGQFPYHRSKDISSSGPVTALEKSRKAELIRTVTITTFTTRICVLGFISQTSASYFLVKQSPLQKPKSSPRQTLAPPEIPRRRSPDRHEKSPRENAPSRNRQDK